MHIQHVETGTRNQDEQLSVERTRHFAVGQGPNGLVNFTTRFLDGACSNATTG